MSAALGDLVVRLAGDIANFELSMSRAEQLANGTSDAIDSAMSRAASSVKNLAAAYVSFESIKAFANQVDDATEFASSLELLSQRLGISSSELSSFKGVAEKSGTSLQTVAQGLSVLGKSMYDTYQGTGRAKVAFEALNLSVKAGNGGLKDAGTFFLELSNKLAGLSSATERNAVAQKVMRGVGSELVPVMLAMADGAERNAVVTDAQAVAAKHYTDALVDLHENNQKLFIMISQQVTPVMEALARTWVDVSTAAGGVNATTKELAAQNQIRAWAVDAAIGVTMVVDGLRYVVVGTQMVIDGVKILVDAAITGFEIIVGAVGTAFASLQDLGTLIRGIAEILGGDFTAGVADVNLALGSLKAGWGGFFDDAKAKAQGLAMNVDGLAGDIQKLMANFKQGATTEAFLAELDAINNRVDKIRTGAKGAGDQINAFKKTAIDGLITSLDKELAALDANIASFQEVGGAAKNLKEQEVLARMNEEDWIATIAQTYAAHKKAGESLEDYTHRVQTAIVIEAEEIDQKRALLAILQEEIKANAATADAMGKAVQSVQDQIDKQKEANATFGLGVDAVANYNIALLENRRRIAEQYDSSQEIVAALDAQIGKWKELRATQLTGKELQDSVAGWKDLSNIIADSATNMVMNWGHAVSDMRNLLKGLLADLIKIFMQKWVLNMVANAFGGAGTAIGSTLISQAAQAGQGTFVGTIYNAFAGQSGVGSSAGGQFGPPDEVGGYSDTYFNQGSAAGGGPSMMGYAGGAVGGAVAGYGYGSLMGNMFGNNRNQQGMAIGGAVGGAAGMVAGMAMGAEYGSVAGPIGMVIGAIIGALLGGLIKSGGAEKQQGAYAGRYSGNAMGGTLVTALNGPDVTQITGSNQEVVAAQTITDNIADGFYKTAAALGAKNVGQMGFAFGFSTDPGGTAPGFIHGAVQNSQGQTVYQNFNDNAPRDTAQFNTEVSTEEERMLVAGLQNIDLGPELNDLFKSFGDVTTATKDDMDLLLAKAIDLRTALVTIDALSKGSFGIKLNIDDIKGYQQAGETLTDTTNRVGGAWVNLVGAFESPMDKLHDEQGNLATLYTTLQAGGYQIPKTREDWLNVMKSIDQSTEAGRTLFLQMLQLAPAFDDVSKASETMMQQFDQIMGKDRPGYTAASQQQTMTEDIASLMAGNSSFAGMSSQSILEMLHNMTREDFAKFDSATQALIIAILNLDDTMKGNTTAVQASTAAVVFGPQYGGDAYGAAMAQYMGMFDQRFGGVIGAAPDTGSKLTLQMGATQDFIKELKDRQAAIQQQYAGFLLPAEFYAIGQTIDSLSASLPDLSKALAQVTVLEAQYGKQKGDQLYDLQTWYDQQKQLVGTNQAALLALEQEYQDKRNAILSGGVADGLSNWQTNIQKFLNDLMTNSQLSPLTPMEQLQSAGKNFEDLLTAAKGGDTNAQGEVQNAAQQYLTAARQQFASGSQYNDIYRHVYDELAGVANAPTYEQQMANALPQGKLASSTDVARVEDAINTLTTVIATGVRVSDPVVQAALDKIAASNATKGTGVFA